MPAISQSVFYFPFPEDPVPENPVQDSCQSLGDEESPYASIDELSGYEPARRGQRNSHLDRETGPGPAHAAPSLDEAGYESIGPRLVAGGASSGASAPRLAYDKGDYAEVLPRALRKAADTKRIYFELESRPTVALKPMFVLAGNAARERRGL